MPPKDDDQDWPEHRMWVKKALEEMQGQLKVINTTLVNLQIRAGVWGFLAGIIPPVVIQMFISLFTKRGQ